MVVRMDGREGTSIRPRHHQRSTIICVDLFLLCLSVLEPLLLALLASWRFKQNRGSSMRRTKIVCTLGPAVETPERNARWPRSGRV